MELEDISAPAAFDALPVEVCQKLLEFIPSHDVAVAKPSSRALAAAARLTLTRGRWKPLKKFCETGREALSHLGSPFCSYYDKQKKVETLALFREVWALEPSEVLVEITSWPEGEVLEFLSVVEPSPGCGMERVLAALTCDRARYAIPEDIRNAINWAWRNKAEREKSEKIERERVAALPAARARQADHNSRYQEAYRAARREGLAPADAMRRAADAVVEGGPLPLPR